MSVIVRRLIQIYSASITGMIRNHVARQGVGGRRLPHNADESACDTPMHSVKVVSAHRPMHLKMLNDVRRVGAHCYYRPMPRAIVFGSAAELRQQLAEWRTVGKSIGLTSGVFDLLHVAHMRFLERASTLVDILLVGVDSDEKVVSRKGKGRPILGESERIEMLSHMRHVGAVYLKSSSRPRWWLISEVRPDVLIVSSEHYGLDDVAKLSQLCGRVEVIRPQPNVATSQRGRIAGWKGEVE